MQTVALSNGLKMPILGYGVFQVSKQECEQCVLDALKVGYRHLDTAQIYGNEEEVGNAIVKSGVPRSEIFLTTKVWITNYGYENCKKSVEESLKKLQTDYIDLMLLHQPFADYYGAWRALEELYEQGKLKAIGISNFFMDRMVDLWAFSRIKPMVDQIEVHPFNQQIESQKWFKKYNVQIETWAPFAEGKSGLFSNATLAAIGKKYNKSVAQVVLRWDIQRGVVVIPKSVHVDRMRQNLDVFDFQLTEEDMNTIASIDQQKTSFFSHEDPSTVEMFMGMVGIPVPQNK